MISHIQKFRGKLAAKQICLGSGVTFSDPAVAEALAGSVDFLWIDLEHSPTGMGALLSLLIAARAGGTAALVRVPSTDVPMLKRVLDTGAEGIILPQVRNAADVRQAVSACRYPPLGTRGWGPRRPSDYGRRSSAQTIAEANEQLFVAAQIESVEAVKDLDAIVAIKGLDSLAIGPNDLSASLGVIGQVTHPKVLAAIDQIVAKAHGAGLSVGFGGGPGVDVTLRAARAGGDWIQSGGDYAYLVNSVEQTFGEVRRQLAS